MAQWRPLHRRITSSDKVIQLAEDPFALWLYCALLPHTDADGRINGNPAGLAGTVFEGFGYSSHQLEAGLNALADVGLIVLYRNGRNQYLVQYTKFQEMCRPDKREARSELPGPRDEGSEVVTGNLPEEFPEPSPDPSAETPGELREDSAKTPRLHMHVHVHEQLHLQSTDTKSAERENEPIDGPPVEAEPRRELTQASRELGKRKTRDPKRIRPIDQPFVDAWNENRGPLPSVLSLDQGRRRHLDKLRAELGDEALDVFTDATKQLAREPFYRQKGYGLTQLLAAGNLLTWAEKWRSSRGMTDADRRLADKAQAVADAIGGL